MTDNRSRKEYYTDPGAGTRPEKGKSHKRSSVRKEYRILFPLVPILLLLLLIVVLESSEKQEETAAESSVRTAEPVSLSVPETEPETTLSPEEIADRELRDRVRDSVADYREFAVLLSDGGVNFRSSPDSSQTGNKIGMLGDLTVCDRLGTEGEWYLVRHDGDSGYVHSSYCTDGEEAGEQARLLLGKEESDTYSDPVIVRAEGNDVRIFSEPVSNDMSLVVGRISSGSSFDILDEADGWCHIRSGPVEGYIRRERCATGEDAIRIAAVKSKDYCRVNAGILYVRSEPVYGRENILGDLRTGERVLVTESAVSGAESSGWVGISGKVHTAEGIREANGYINVGGNNAELLFGLENAQETDARELVLEGYGNPIVCVTSGYVNIRESTSTDSYKNIVGKIYKGNGAELLGTVSAQDSGDGSKWYKIRSGGVTGYVSAGTKDAEWFALGDAAKETATSYARLTANITADRLNVRSSPSKENDSNVWTQVTRGQAYEILEQEGDWIKIDLGSDESDNEAYISKNEAFIRISYGLEEAIEFSYAEKASAFRQSIVDYACQFIGNPYVWGGNSLTNGCDCSGFVQQIMKRYGISMERSSYYQAKQGTRRLSSSMRPGDLIFYAGSNGVVNHVGIYIGGGYMVGAQSRRSGIKVVKWNYRTPVAIRDVIGDRIE